MIWPIWRPIVAEIQQRESREMEEKETQLAEKVAEARFDHIKNKLEADLTTLKKHLDSSETAAAETAKDNKYFRERQLILA